MQDHGHRERSELRAVSNKTIDDSYFTIKMESIKRKQTQVGYLVRLP